MRHQTTHATSPGDGNARQRRERAHKACQRCATAKVKCDDSRPCKRCRDKCLTCTTTNESRPSLCTLEANWIQKTTSSASQQSAQPLKDSLETITGNVESNQLTAGTEPRVSSLALGDTFGDEVIMSNDFSIPAFFEHIMVSDLDWMRGGYIQPPPDLTTWMQDVDCFDSVDPFSSDFVPNVDDVFNGAYFAPIADTEEIRAPESSGIRNHGDEDARRRHIAFQRSPWY